MRVSVDCGRVAKRVISLIKKEELFKNAECYTETITLKASNRDSVYHYKAS